MLRFQLLAQTLELKAATVPNQYPFVALITYAGKQSDYFVGGTETVDGGPYHVQIPVDVLKDKIRSIEGKSVYANDELNSHEDCEPVGKFISAWVAPHQLPDGTMAMAGWASGLLHRDSNPEKVDEIVAKAREGILGFSFDLKEVKYKMKASASSGPQQFLELVDFKWRGATILKREAAAYQNTLLAASKVEHKEPLEMDEKALKDLIAGISAAVGTAVADAVKPLTSAVSELKTDVATLKEIKAAATPATPATPAAGNPSATKFSLKDLTDVIGNAVKEAIKPLEDKLTAASTQKDEKIAGRKSFSAADVAFAGKYGTAKEGDPVTSKTYQEIIDNINADASLDNDSKKRMLDGPSLRKRELQRIEVRAMGGAA